MTPYALFPVEHRLAVLSEPDGLMAAVRTGDRAASAADALLPAELREKYRIPLQHVSGITDGV